MAEKSIFQVGAFRFSGRTGRSNSRTHEARSLQPPSGGLAYRALCGAVIRTTGGSVDGVNCPQCRKLQGVEERPTP